MLASSTAPEPPDLEHRCAAPSRRLLVTGGESASRRHARSILHQAGLSVFECDLSVCTQIVLRSFPYAVLVDCAVDPAPAIEALRRIREHAPALPVLVLIGKKERAILDRAFAAGASGWASKGANVRTWRKQIEAFLPSLGQGPGAEVHVLRQAHS